MLADWSLKTSQAFQELAWFMRRERYNCRKYHCYVDEDCIGFIKGLCRRVHRRMLELRVLGRWSIRLGAYRLKPIPINESERAGYGEL